jgi:PKD repeat protein
VTQYIVGQNATFTASLAPACLASVTYAWVITDFGNTVVNFTGNSISYSFPKYGTYSVKLTASTSTPGYTSVSTTENICVAFPSNLGLVINVDGPTTVYYCDPVNSSTKTFTAVVQGINASVVSGLISSAAYTWYITDNTGAMVPASTLVGYEVGLVVNGKTLTRSFPGQAYSVTCVVKFEAPGGSSTPASTCNEQAALLAPAANTTITFINNSPCP